MDAHKLVRMANQVAHFYARDPVERAAAEIEDHLRKFWDPRMRGDIVAHLASGGEGLLPATRLAVERLRDEHAYVAGGPGGS